MYVNPGCNLFSGARVNGRLHAPRRTIRNDARFGFQNINDFIPPNPRRLLFVITRGGWVAFQTGKSCSGDTTGFRIDDIPRPAPRAARGNDEWFFLRFLFPDSAERVEGTSPVGMARERSSSRIPARLVYFNSRRHVGRIKYKSNPRSNFRVPRRILGSARRGHRATSRARFFV